MTSLVQVAVLVGAIASSSTADTTKELNTNFEVDTLHATAAPFPEKIYGYPIYVDYPAYYFLNGEVVPYLEKIIKGVSQAEEYFGLKRTENIRNICLTGHFYAERTASFVEPATLKFHIAELDTTYSLAADAFHEMVHLIDYKSGGLLSAGKFSALHKEILSAYPEFFSLLNESNFIGSRPRFGHSEDNAGEFLASFVSSLHFSSWSQCMQEMDPKFRKIYLEALDALSENLKQVSFVSSTATIVLDINNKLIKLQSMLEHSTEVEP